MLMNALAVLAAFGAPLVAGKTYDLPKGGKFDYMAVDNKYHRVFATHTGAKTLAVLDTETGKIDEVDTGLVNGVQVATKLNRIFVAGGGGKLVALDRETLKILGSVELGGPGDDLAVDTKRNEVYVCHDDGTEDWVFDATTLKLITKVAIEEAPEYVEYDATTDKLYQNIKSTNHLQVIDPESKKVTATWPTGAMTSPHGLALDRKGGFGYSAGKNGKLVVFELASGKIVTTVDIAPGTDQIAIDTALHRVYCPGSGKMTVVQADGANSKSIGDVDVPKGVHTLAANNKTHEVWVCYGDDSSAHIAQFKATE